MGVTRKDNQTNTGFQGTNQQTQAPQGNSRTAFNQNAFGIGTRLDAMGNGGEQYEKIFEHMTKQAKYLNEGQSELKYAVVKVLRQVAGLNYSGIVVCETAGTITSAHILMIEKTGDYPSVLVENIGNVRYELIRTPADALDTRYVTQSKAIVADALGVSTDSVIITDGTLIPTEFDVNFEPKMDDVFRNAIRSVRCENTIRVDNYSGFNIADIVTNNAAGKFVINMFFNGDRTQHHNAVDMPVRQDVCVTLSYKNGSGNNSRSINQADNMVELVRTYGYVDFEFIAQQQQNGMMSTQRFAPNFIITGIETGPATTPDLALLGVVSVAALNEDMNWLQMFKPSPARKGEIDYNDIGALNVEGNLEGNPTGFGKLYDTKAKEFTLLELNNFCQTLVRPNLMVSIDLPKAGPETWYTSVFSHIKFKNDKGAIDRVSRHLNTLTNGNFGTSHPMFLEISNKIHGGYFRTKSGVEDIRCVSSYLAIANHVSATNQSPMLINQYTNTMYNINIPADLRAAERAKMLTDIVGGSAVYKQYYDRVTFNAAFLGDLISSMRMTGFDPIFENMAMNNDMFQRRATMDVSAATLAPGLRLMGQTDLFSNYGAQAGYNRSY